LKSAGEAYEMSGRTWRIRNLTHSPRYAARILISEVFLRRFLLFRIYCSFSCRNLLNVL